MLEKLRKKVSHLYNDIIGDACSHGALVSVCRENNIPGTADQRDLIFMFFFFYQSVDCMLRMIEHMNWP